MKSKLLPVLFVLLVVPALASAQTIVERLRALDAQRASGAITEEAYQEQWRSVVAEGMRQAGVEPGKSVSRSMPAMTNQLDRDWEIAFSGSWSRLSAGDSDLTTTAVDLSLGRFITKSLLVFATADYLKADIDGDNLEAYGVGIGADWHFGDRATGFLPYVGAGIAWANVDVSGVGDDNDFVWDVHAGVRQYVGDRVVIKYQAQYQQYNDLDLDGFGVSVGIGLRF